MMKIQCDGCYPEQYVRLLRLLPEQVLDVVKRTTWVLDTVTHREPEAEDIVAEEILGNGWINKGWKLLSHQSRTAIYKHDGRWWLIQFYGKPLLDERKA